MALRSAAQRLTVSVGQCIWRGLEPGVTRAGRGAAFDGVGFDAIVAVANAVGVSIGPSQLKQSIADVIGRGRGEGRRQPGARHELYAGDEAQVLGTLAMDTLWPAASTDGSDGASGTRPTALAAPSLAICSGACPTPSTF